MELNDYKLQSAPLTVTLRGGIELGLEYYVNYLTVPMMEEIGKAEAQTDGQDVTIKHLSKLLKSVDITDNGKPVPFKTDADKEKVLRVFSAFDHNTIVSSVQEDILSETKKDSTDSVDG